MLLIYSPRITNRIRYIFNLIFKDILVTDFKIISDIEAFKNFGGAKISYGQQPVSDELFFRSANHPDRKEEFLLETEIKKQNLKVSDWNGIKIFFQTENSSLPYDPFAASFFLVSRYEEYLPFTPDEYGRFSAKQSLSFQNEFLQKPIVNIWAQHIKKNILEKFPGFKFPEIKYNFIPTIDIDNAYAYLGKGILRTMGSYVKALLCFKIADIKLRTNAIRKKEDPYDTYLFLSSLHLKYNLNPIYFFLLGNWAKNDKNLSASSKMMQSLIQSISLKYDIGIHPSFASNKFPEKIIIEKKRLSTIAKKQITKSRQHFLMLKFPDTYRNLIDAGITDDYSHGYVDEIGFRAGTCSSFYFYDLQKEEETKLRIHPFAVMDATLNLYMKLSPEEAIKRTKEIIREVKSVHGTFITIWHNETLSEWKEWTGWRKVYKEIVKDAVL
ncbi:MAG: polysaccharide deacetylase family protein [Bacteroidota bacterium]